MKKGFTLIELLAVIVVLAVIAIIVIPIITNVIDKTKEGSFKDSVLSAFDSIDYTLYKNKTYDFESIDVKDLDIKNNKLNGEFKKENKKIIAYYISDGKYCAYGTKNNLKIAKSCSDIDIVIPSLEIKLEGKVAKITLKDNESGVVSYCVTNENSTENCEWINIEKAKEKEVTYEGKASGTYYVFTKDSASNISESKEFNLEQNLFCAYDPGKTWEYDYTGSEQEFTVPCEGNYKLETWGASGGISGSYTGGYGSYSIGYLKSDNNLLKLHIYIGGQGKLNSGGYNGGGNGSAYSSGGGGATHIATNSGLLNTLSNNVDKILIVSGGGGGAVNHNSPNPSGNGGNAGGYLGSAGTAGGWAVRSGQGATQTAGGIYGLCSDSTVCGSAGSFGTGGSSISCSAANCNSEYQAGGGGGFYGGGSARHAGGGGGSGYIGNTSLTNKVMYCYNCSESSDIATKTISTTNVSATPTSNYAKQGNGYAKITLVGID